MAIRVYFVSDRTGITAETLGNSLLSQFDDIVFDKVTQPFIDTPEKANRVIADIQKHKSDTNDTIIVFATMVDEQIRAIIHQCKAVVLDFFNAFIKPLEEALEKKSSHSIGRFHSILTGGQYQSRIKAIEYTLNCDDGVGQQNYDKSDIILVGVSRCGKTPTCLYMAMQYGLFAANYPFTDEDIEQGKIPASLLGNKAKLFGLTIDAERLHAVRTERRADSKYASLSQCRLELGELEDIFQREKIPYLNTTNLSIEEISATILLETGLKRRSF